MARGQDRRRAPRLLTAVALGLGLLVSPLAATRLPDWARAVVDLPPLELPGDVPAVVLLHEGHREFLGGDRSRMRQRGVVRILRRDGRPHAKAVLPYNSKGDRIQGFSAWHVRAGGKVDFLHQREAVDMEMNPMQMLYTEGRIRVLIPHGNIPVGSAFCWEWTVESRSPYLQDIWVMRQELPVQVSRLSVTVPARWSVHGTPLNGVAISNSSSGRTWVWEAGDLQGIFEQPWSPPPWRMLNGIGVNPLPPPAERSGLLVFESWADVARHQREISGPPMAPTPAVRRVAHERIADADTPWGKIQALAAFAQSLNYVAVAIDLHRGGGYRPNPADTVLERRYGDCKDKTTLLRALLAAVGVETFSVLVRAGPGPAVEPGWPSPMVFDHMIIALRPPPGVDLPAMVNDPEIGPLLFFDPTDPDTVLGDLPVELQDTLALVDAEATSGLVRLPRLGGQHYRREERVDVVLAPSGAIEVKVAAKYVGQDARELRTALRRYTDRDRRERRLRDLHQNLPTAELGSLELTDDPASGILREHLAFNHRSHARRMGDQMLVLRPLVWNRRIGMAPASDSAGRRNPVRLPAEDQLQTTRIQLPDGFTLDAAPKDTSITEEFGEFHLTHDFDGQVLTLSRRRITLPVDLPAADFARLQAFLRAQIDAEDQLLVLIRK